MKMRKIYRTFLALALALALAAPAFASGEASDGLEQPSAQDPAVQPEVPAEVPDWVLGPEDGEQTTPESPADSVVPENPAIPETPETPETPENPEVPGEILPPAGPEVPEENPETPEVPVVPENPETPVDPEIPETPENPENPEIPETPVNPEEPMPPSWLLPPEEAPSLPVAPGADEPALLPPENALAEEAPVIEVLIPSTGRVIINPYGLPVELDGQTSTDQIVSAPLILQNLSTVPVSVSASVTGTVPPGSGVSFAAAPPMPDTPMKEIFLFAEFQQVPDPVLQPAWSGLYSDSTNQLLVGSQSAAKADVLRLEASGFGAMRLFGSAAVSPVNPWQVGDDIRADFVFSFTPIIDDPLIEPSVVDDFVTDTPVVDAPAADAPVMEVPATDTPDMPVSGGPSDDGFLSVPGWLFDT